MKNMKIFVINLKRSVERRALVESQLQERALEYSIFEAIDGHSLSDSDVTRLCDANAVHQYSKFLTKGLIGASLSHYGVQQKILEEDLDKALVLEDDVLLSDDLALLLDSLEPEVATNEIILLCFSAFQPIILSNTMKKPLVAGFHLAYPVDLTVLGTACGYVITREAARNMVDFNRPLKIVCDCWGEFWSHGCFESMRCVAPMAVQPAHLRSDIGYLDNTRILGRIKSLAHHFDTRLVNKALAWRREQLWKRRTNYTFSDEVPRNQRGQVPIGLT